MTSLSAWIEGLTDEECHDLARIGYEQFHDNDSVEGRRYAATIIRAALLALAPKEETE